MSVVWYAVRTGRLIRQPCEVCGATKVDGHHDDYEKLLDVRWLCRSHHKQLHSRLKAQQAREQRAWERPPTPRSMMA